VAGTTSTGGARRAPISGINITPLVDVMLVLLVIMMVSATYIVSQSMKVDLPKTSTSDGRLPTVAAITITVDHEILLDKQPVTEDELRERLGALVGADAQLTLMVTADRQADHGDVIHVLDVARTQGITQFAVNVERRPD
jgi:biopolymer transport protein ExbD